MEDMKQLTQDRLQVLMYGKKSSKTEKLEGKGGGGVRIPNSVTRFTSILISRNDKKALRLLKKGLHGLGIWRGLESKGKTN